MTKAIVRLYFVVRDLTNERENLTLIGHRKQLTVP